ncbi:MAG: hypothetical protein IH591_15930 [Bacteroidales bacterium]|nr:hypothetical protein [Bacteroidales bacterium]
MAAYFKNEGIIKSYDGFTNDIDGGLFSFPTKTNIPDALLSVIQPFELKELVSNNDTLNISGNLQQLIDSIEYEGNPVLMIMKLKSSGI